MRKFTLLPAMVLAVVLCAVPSAFADETWTLANSPIVISGEHVILTGVTVTVEPGVVVQLQQNALLDVQGSLIGAGTAVSPIRFEGPSASISVSGTLDLSYGVVEPLVEAASWGSLSFADTAFSATATLSTGGTGSFISLVRCTFDGSHVWLGGATIRIEDTSVLNNFMSLGGSWVRMDNVSVSNAPQWSLRFVDFDQPVYIDNVTASNSASGGLDLVAGNFFIGSNVQLFDNQYPVRLGGAGILPGSVLPTSGNVNNQIQVEFQSNGSWSTVWADAGIPYAMTGGQYHAGALEILPGVTVLLEPDFTFWDDESVIDARGLPGDPVHFAPLVPGQTWQGLQYFHRFENCIIEGGQVGARFSSWTTGGYIDNCIIRDNDVGTQNSSTIRKTRFLNNTVGVWDNAVDGALESTTNPNSFVGNTLAVDYTDSLIDARFSWWGDPSGPTSPNNPGGTGDPADLGVAVVPFLTAEPDYSDNPPIVRLLKGPRTENAGGSYSSFIDPGTVAIITWESEDDVAVAAHRIEFYHSFDSTWTVVAELPGWQRSYEWNVPQVGYIGNSTVPKLRVVAIDSAGQEGWDEHSYQIHAGEVTGELNVLLDVSGNPFVVGEAIGPLCYEAVGSPLYSSVVAELSFDSDQRHIPLGNAFVGGCLGGASATGPTVPFVSTDTARIRLSNSSGQNRVKHYFSDYFTIRPDLRVGDAPPTVTMTSPVGGESFPGGGVVPIHWTASDDEGLRAVDIQVSTDGARTWHYIAEDLPGTATFFDWQLPPSGGLADVRVRVMVTDLRFQTSSSGGDVTFGILAGSGGSLPHSWRRDILSSPPRHHHPAPDSPPDI